LCRVFNFRSGCMQTMHLLSSVAIQPNLELKTWPKQLLGSLPLVIALTALMVNCVVSSQSKSLGTSPAICYFLCRKYYLPFFLFTKQATLLRISIGTKPSLSMSVPWLALRASLTLAKFFGRNR
jgi:hypothetical protein